MFSGAPYASVPYSGVLPLLGRSATVALLAGGGLSLAGARGVSQGAAPAAGSTVAAPLARGHSPGIVVISGGATAAVTARWAFASVDIPSGSLVNLGSLKGLVQAANPIGGGSIGATTSAVLINLFDFILPADRQVHIGGGRTVAAPGAVTIQIGPQRRIS